MKLTFYEGFVQSKHFPSGEKELDFEFPYKNFVGVTWTSDESHIVCYGCEKQKAHLFVHNAKNGKLIHKWIEKLIKGVKDNVRKKNSKSGWKLHELAQY